MNPDLVIRRPVPVFLNTLNKQCKRKSTVLVKVTKRNGTWSLRPFGPRNVGYFIILRELSVLGCLLFPSRKTNNGSRAAIGSI